MYLYQLMGDKKADGPRDEAVAVLGSGGLPQQQVVFETSGSESEPMNKSENFI